MRGLPTECEDMSARDADLRLMVQAVTRAGGRARTLRDGDTLRSGDRFHLKVCTNHSARLYLLQSTAAGVTMLRPTERHGEMIEPRAVVRIPDTGHDITLDDQPGDERLFVIASDRPIEESDPRVAAALSRLRARPEAPRIDPMHTPGPPTARTAALVVDDRPDLSGMAAAFNPQGTTRTLSIEPSADDGAEVTELTGRLVVWRLDLRHAP
jgi:hypothetical protein